MCLEIELRTGGILDDLVRSLHRLLKSPRLTLAIMPAFLGLLPSLGGARFSAPIVEITAKGLNLTAEHKANINFWFRHIFEFSSPIIPGMLMACSIAAIPFSSLLLHLAWVTPLFFLVGWLILTSAAHSYRNRKSKSCKRIKNSLLCHCPGCRQLYFNNRF